MLHVHVTRLPTCRGWDIGILGSEEDVSRGGWAVQVHCSPLDSWEAQRHYSHC